MSFGNGATWAPCLLCFHTKRLIKIDNRKPTYFHKIILLKNEKPGEIGQNAAIFC